MALLVASLRCGIRDDELMCEEAAAHLKECCPGFDPTPLDCSRWTACGTTHSPDIDINTATCITERSCGDLESRGTCAAVMSSVIINPSLSGVCP